MGNITAIIVVCSVCGFLIICLLFLYKKLKSKNSKSKLDEEINRYKNMNKGDSYNSQSVDNAKESKKIKKEQKVQIKQQKAKEKTLKLQEKLKAKIDVENLEQQEENNENEDFQNLFNETNFEKNMEYNKANENIFDDNLNNDFFKRKKNIEKKIDRDEDFDKFMDEFSYSRAPKNKSLLEQIEKLPPKTKAIILNNIFNKFDD